MTSTICLNMIVKDEVHCLERCLTSVLPLIDRWLIVDTGSTDGTQDLVRRVLADKPGELVERPWVDFATNRNEALRLVRDSELAVAGDYALFIDADDQLRHVPSSLSLTADGYSLVIEYGAIRYHRVALADLARPWRWEGVLHEYLALEDAQLDVLSEPVIVVEKAGNRSRDPDLYVQDAALLERALEANPDDTRSLFYLAQSWRDAGEVERALAGYRRRLANEGGWDQERWYSAYQIGVLLDQMARPAERVAAAYLDAFQLRPTRAEPLVALARLERLKGRYEVALLYAARAVEIAAPPLTDLFVEVEVYEWVAWDEYAVSAYWAGYLDSGEPAARRALAARPADERLRANVRYFEEKRAAQSWGD